MKLTVIGGGPGGYVAAFEAARAGFEVTLVERDNLGGACLNRGCIPTKTLRSSADALETARRLAEFGISGGGDAAPDPAAILARKNRVRDLLLGGLEKTCASLKVRLLRGRGRLTSPRHVEVSAADGVIGVDADAVVIATGSEVLELPGLPFDHVHVLSSDDALELDRLPGRLIIVGGGVIGCELACIHRAFGAEVTIVEGQDRLLPIPSADADAVAVLQREMRKRKIAAECGRTLRDLRVEDGVVRAVVAPSPFVENPTPAQLRETPAEADMVLVTVGRRPSTDGLGLEDIGVRTDARGWIEVNERLETSVPGVYAIGDVLGPSRIMLAHVASAEAVCVVDALRGRPRDMDRSVVPSAIFTSPEIGCVGMSEAQAREAGRDVRCATIQMRGLGKAHAMGEPAGLFKLVTDAGTGAVLGAHVVGAHASDLVAEAAIAMRMGATAEDIAATIHAHPTLAEGMHEAALQLRG